MKENIFSEKAVKVFKASLGAIPEVKQYILEKTGPLLRDKKKEMQILLAVEEIIVNIINHAQIKRPEIIIEIDISSKKLTVKILDYGIPFNPLEVGEPDIKSSLLEREIGGLGLFLVRQVVDEIKYQRIDEKNCIIMVFNLSN